MSQPLFRTNHISSRTRHRWVILVRNPITPHTRCKIYYNICITIPYPINNFFKQLWISRSFSSLWISNMNMRYGSASFGSFYCRIGHFFWRHWHVRTLFSCIPCTCNCATYHYIKIHLFYSLFLD